MKILVYDMSANGKPLKWDAPYNDTVNWPRLVHLSWQFMDEKGKLVKERNDVIKPIDFAVRKDTLKNHHLTPEDLDNGTDLTEALNAFNEVLEEADHVFSHNHRLNAGIIRAEYVRMEVKDRLYIADAYCLMQESTYFCKIPGKYGKFKWPSLTELHKTLFKRGFNQSGNAHADMLAVGRCFIVMNKLGVLEDIF